MLLLIAVVAIVVSEAVNHAAVILAIANTVAMRDLYVCYTLLYIGAGTMCNYIVATKKP